MYHFCTVWTGMTTLGLWGPYTNGVLLYIIDNNQQATASLQV